MMKGKGKRGEVPFKDELPFNPVRRTEARTVGGGGGWRSRAMRIGKQLSKLKKIIIKNRNQVLKPEFSDVLTFMIR